MSQSQDPRTKSRSPKRAQCRAKPLMFQPPDDNFVGHKLEEISQRVTNKERLGELQELVLRQVYPHYQFFRDHHFSKLPGPQPRTLSRRSLRGQLVNEEFLVAEKSDGQRMMLLFDDQQTFLIDRPFQVFQLNVPISLFAHTSRRGFSSRRGFNDDRSRRNNLVLVDGELMWCQARPTREDEPDEEEKSGESVERLMFQMFDCVTFEGLSLTKEYTTTRIAKLRTIKRHFEAAIQGRYLSPFLLECKRMEPVSQISRILACISVQQDETGRRYHVYSDPDGDRLSLNDGLVFTMVQCGYDMKYWRGWGEQAVEDVGLRKWKPLEENTIDLEVQRPFFDDEGNLLLYGGQEEPFGKVPRSAVGEQFDALLEQAQAANHGDSFVIECFHDPSRNVWELRRNRLDKTEGNFDPSDVVEKIRENITTDELVEVLARGQKQSNGRSRERYQRY